MQQVLTLLAGFCVLAYNRWNIRRHEAAEALSKERGQLLPMLPKDEVPFGARALESGIQTEGIWISNPNTPVPSPYMPGTPVGSLPSSPALKPSTILPVSPALETLIKNPEVTSLFGPSGSMSRLSSELELPPSYTSQPQLPGVVHTPAGIHDNQTFMETAHQPQTGVLRSRERRHSFQARIFGPSRTPMAPTSTETILDFPNRSTMNSAMIGVGAHHPTQRDRASRMKRMLHISHVRAD